MSGLKIMNCFVNAMMLKDALEKHPKVQEVIYNPCRPLKNFGDFDLLISPSFGSRGLGERDFDPNRQECRFVKWLDDNKLYNKWIIWDTAADWSIWEWGLEKCLVYFKKSWQKTEYPPKTYRLSWPVLDTFVKIPTDIYTRDIDVGFYFPALKNSNLASHRGKILHHIKKFKWSPDVYIELTYTLGGKYHYYDMWNQEIIINGQLNWWQVYMHLLRRTKILFTSSGGVGFFGADRRTMEAMSSGALVFSDEPHSQMHPPFEHGKHLFFFDSTNDEAVVEAIELANHYLTKEKKEEREAIARAGLDHAMTYHRSKNYVDYMIEIILREMGHD